MRVPMFVPKYVDVSMLAGRGEPALHVTAGNRREAGRAAIGNMRPLLHCVVLATALLNSAGLTALAIMPPAEVPCTSQRFATGP